MTDIERDKLNRRRAVLAGLAALSDASVLAMGENDYKDLVFVLRWATQKASPLRNANNG